MADGEIRLDLILSTRLELLEQALDEVEKIIDAMEEQSRHLDEVEQCLGPRGDLVAREKDVKRAVGDAMNRLELVLDGGVDPDSGDAEDLQEALEHLTSIKDVLTNLAGDRGRAYESFLDVRRWSVAGLTHKELADAEEDYRKLLREIRDDDHPWQRYESELRGRGQELFTRYLELLGGMAVRGFAVEGEMAGDAQALARLLLQPLGTAAKGARPQRTPYLPMRTRHVPLGYPHWSLWVLPLVGRSIGEYVLSKKTFQTPIDNRLQVLCADIYALFVLGPSYAHAALFLELDPDDASEDDAQQKLVPDSLRAQAMLEKLPKLHDGLEDELAAIADQLAEPWTQARQALGYGDVSLDPADRQVIDRFFTELRDSYNEIAFDARFLVDSRQIVDKIAGTDSLDTVQVLHPRELVTALWLARLEHPKAVRHLHERAEELAKRTMDLRPGDAKPSRPARLRSR